MRVSDSGHSSMKPGDPNVVRATARAFERDRYLAALLAPADVRDDLLALAAFAGEIARIPGDVSQPMIGEIRLQWWRDALQTSDGAVGHPIADALARTLRRREVPFELIHRVLDAQIERLEDRPFDDLDRLVAHLAGFDGGLFEAAWRMLGGHGPAPPVLAEAGGVYGLSRCLIEAPAELAQGRIVLPASLLERHGVAAHAGADNPGGNDPAAGWRAVQNELAGAVEARLMRLLQGYQEADRQVRFAALPIALVRPYLEASKRGEIMSLRAIDIAPFIRVWRIWRTSRTGRF